MCLNILIKGQVLIPVGIRTLHCPARSQVTVSTFIYNCIAVSIKNLMTLSANLTLFFFTLRQMVRHELVFGYSAEYPLLFVTPRPHCQSITNSASSYIRPGDSHRSPTVFAVFLPPSLFQKQSSLETSTPSCFFFHWHYSPL